MQDFRWNPSLSRNSIKANLLYSLLSLQFFSVVAMVNQLCVPLCKFFPLWIGLPFALGGCFSDEGCYKARRLTRHFLWCLFTLPPKARSPPFPHSSTTFRIPLIITNMQTTSSYAREKPHRFIIHQARVLTDTSLKHCILIKAKGNANNYMYDSVD